MHRFPLLFHQNIFYQNNLTVVRHPPFFSLLPLLTMTLKVLHFDTVDVIEAEWSTVLNTLTEHNAQDVFKQ
jgi:hypothetical protein